MKGDQLARSYLLLSIPNDIYMSIDSNKRNAKGMWDEIEKFMLGTKIGTQLKVTNCISQYEDFKAKEGESLSTTYTRFVHLVNELSKNDIRKTKIENNVKFVSNLLPEWRRFANQIKHSKFLAELDLHEVYETLLQDEEEVLEAMATKIKKPADPIALVAKETPVPLNEEIPELNDEEFDYDPDIAQFQQQLVLLTKAFKQKFSRRSNPNQQRYASGSKNYEHKSIFESKPKREEQRPPVKPEDKFKGEKSLCYNCGKSGHYARECKKPIVKDSNYFT